MTLCQAQFHFHPSRSKRSGRSKGFDVGVARGPNVKGTPTIACRSCNSRSLIFLIASTPRVTLRPDIRGHLVVLWFPTSTRGRSSCAHSSSPPVPENFHWMLVNIRKFMVNIVLHVAYSLYVVLALISTQFLVLTLREMPNELVCHKIQVK